MAGEHRTGFRLEAEHHDLVMSRAAFARFVEALDAPAEVVPEMVEMFRLPRISEEGAGQQGRTQRCRS